MAIDDIDDLSHSCDDIACMANMVALGYEHDICHMEHDRLIEYLEFISDDPGLV